MNKQLILEKVEKLYQLFEDRAFPITHKHEVNPGLPLGSNENFIYFTLPVSINYQRSSPAMWQAALKTYEDQTTRYLFNPHEVTKRSIETVRDGLLKHKLGLQPNKHTSTWYSLSQTFSKLYPNGPQEFFAKHDWDVLKIIPALRKTEKKSFPNLGGAKLSHYWLYILHNFTNAQFKKLSAISIIPDTHVLQASVVLGLTSEADTPDIVAEKWYELLEGSRFSPIDLHPVLWNWSRNNFSPAV